MQAEKTHTVRELASYRVTLRPDGMDSDTPVLPSIRVKATCADCAMEAAHHITGRPVIEAVRIEGEAA